MQVAFFCFYANSAIGPQSPRIDRYSWKFWRPYGLSVVPRGLPAYPFLVWSLFHHLRFFSNTDYCLFLAFSGKEVVHRAVVTPGYFRFPFMSKNDLQIGDVWTHPDHRGKGLATYSLREIGGRQWAEGRRFWYIVDVGNSASIRVAEKAGFVKCGEGIRTKRFGQNLFGAYEMITQFEVPESLKGK
jgi:RimJ/RimL family protein N-acetyltransferase